MKTKLLAIVLSILFLVQPVAAVGMVGVESAAEIVSAIPEQAEEEKEAVAMADSEQPENVLFYDDFETNEVREINQVGTGAGLTPAYRKDGITITLGSTDRTNNYVVDDVTYSSNPHWQIIDEDGNKVLFISQYNGPANNAGIDFNSIKFHDPGVYTLSFKLKTELGKNAEGFGASAGADFTWFQTQTTDAEGNKNDKYNLTCSGINGTNGNANLGKWFNVQYRFIVTDNGDGTRSIAIKSNQNPWNPATRTLAEGEYLSRFRHYFKLYPEKISQGNLYFDDMKLTFDSAVNVTYVNAAGETLATASNYSGDTITLAKANAGLTYPVQFEIDGVKYNEGATYTIPHGTTNLEIKVTGYDMPANAPVNAIVFEDFDYTSVTNSGDGAVKYADRDFFSSSVPLVGRYGSPYDYSYGTFDGKSVLNIGGTSGSYEGFKFMTLKLTKPGKYVTSIKYYSEVDDKNFAVTSTDYHLNAYQVVNGTETHVSNNKSTFGTVEAQTRNTWFTGVASMIITEDENGQLYRGSTAISNVDRLLLFTKQTATANEGVTDTFGWTLHVDEASIQYFAPVTVKYVDDLGNTIKTYETFQNEQYALPSATDMGYISSFAYAGTTYNPGETFTVPADAASEITIKATRRAMPTDAPEGIVFYEDFQNRTVGTSLSTTPETLSYSIGPEFDSAAIAISTESASTSIPKKYQITPDSTDNIAYATTASGTYHHTLQINLPADLPVGKYTYSHDVYIDNDDVDTADNDGDGNTTEYLSSMSHWGRVWASSKNLSTLWMSADSAQYRKNWFTYSDTFEVYEENGVKYFKKGSNAIELGTNNFIKMHITNGNTTLNFNTYYDNIMLTVEKPTLVKASFYPDEGSAYDYTENFYSYEGKYTFPTKDVAGFGFNPEYYVDGVKYLPGETIPFSGDVCEFDIIVKKTNTIIRESFDDDAVNSSGKIANHTMTYNLLGTGSYVGAGDFGNTQSFETVVESGRNVLKVTKISATNSYIALNFMNLGLSEPGEYTVNMIFKPSEIIANKGMNIQNKVGSFDRGLGAISGMPVDKDGYLTASMVYNIYRNADGVLCASTPYNGTKTEIPLDGSYYAEGKYREYGNQINNLMIYHTGATEGYCWYVDEISVDYTPYAPTNTMKAGYREANYEDEKPGPEGVRFAAYVNNTQRDILDEYGFIVTLETSLTSDDQLHLSGIETVKADGKTAYKNSDNVVVIAAAAFNKESEIDRVYTTDGDTFELKGLYDTFYTAVLYGIDDAKKASVFVTRPYAKINGVYYYGECHRASYNSVKAAATAANA